MQAHIWYLCLKNFWIFLKGLIWTRFVIYTFVPKICDTCKPPTYEVGIYFGMLGFIFMHSPTVVWICSSPNFIFSTYLFSHVLALLTSPRLGSWQPLWKLQHDQCCTIFRFYQNHWSQFFILLKNRNNLNVGLSLVFPI